MSSHSTEKKEFRFYLNGEDKKLPSDNEDNIYRNYILIQNNSLQAENIKYREEHAEATNRIEELEGEQDFIDKRTNNIKGLCKNLHEVDKLRSNYINSSNMIITNQSRSIKQFMSQLRTFKMIYLGCWLFLCVVSILWLDWGCIIIMIPTTCINLYVIDFITKGDDIYNPQTDNQKLRMIENQINDINKANDYIHEFIDSQ